MGSENTIQVGIAFVEAHNSLQTLIDSAKTNLNKITPDTKPWKQMNAEIEKMENAAKGMKRIIDKGFINQSDATKFNTEWDRARLSVEAYNKATQNIKTTNVLGTASLDLQNAVKQLENFEKTWRNLNARTFAGVGKISVTGKNGQKTSAEKVLAEAAQISGLEKGEQENLNSLSGSSNSHVKTAIEITSNLLKKYTAEAQKAKTATDNLQKSLEKAKTDYSNAITPIKENYAKQQLDNEATDASARKKSLGLTSYGLNNDFLQVQAHSDALNRRAESALKAMSGKDSAVNALRSFQVSLKSIWSEYDKEDAKEITEKILAACGFDKGTLDNVQDSILTNSSEVYKVLKGATSKFKDGEQWWKEKAPNVTSDLNNNAIQEQRNTYLKQLEDGLKPLFNNNRGILNNTKNSGTAYQILEANGLDEDQINTVISTIKKRGKDLKQALEDFFANISNEDFEKIKARVSDKANNFLSSRVSQVTDAEVEGLGNLPTLRTKISDAESSYNASAENLSQQEATVAQLQAKIAEFQNIEEDLKNRLATAEQNIKNQNEVIERLKGEIINDSKLDVDVPGKVSGQKAPAKDAPSFGEAAQKNLYGSVMAIFDGKDKVDQISKSVENFASRFIGLNAIVHVVRRGFRQAVNDIKSLDKAMTNIAVVTDMTNKQLWGQINAYMALAQQYGVTTQGVYEVSQLYYQQGLSSSKVNQLTAETLKLARIAGIDYKDAADAMTVAVRAFKMEMSDANVVTDVYSKVASVSASNAKELATAMSKTASSAASVGASFENTTAMLAVMIETTREAPENIGSSMKSIISRYGELKTGMTEDGDASEMDFNKTDTALKSIGISIKTATGQFRDFDDVILELAQKWDTLDKNTQRYIATTMAFLKTRSVI